MSRVQAPRRVFVVIIKADDGHLCDLEAATKACFNRVFTAGGNGLGLKLVTLGLKSGIVVKRYDGGKRRSFECAGPEVNLWLASCGSCLPASLYGSDSNQVSRILSLVPTDACLFRDEPQDFTRL